MDYTSSPMYQRMMQRIQRIRPEQAAILNTLAPDSKFAGEELRKTMASTAQAANVNYANRSLDLRSRAVGADTGLMRDRYDEWVDKNRTATGVGLGQVAAETYYGKRRDDIDLETYKKKMAFMNRLGSLYGGE